MSDPKSTAIELVRVPFDGDTLEAVKRDDGIWVGVKRACENVGLDSQAQCRRLERSRWAITATMAAVAEDGKNREMTMLRLDKVPMWLATIEVSRVDPAIRPKLELYQKQAADVLAAHFTPVAAEAAGIAAGTFTFDMKEFVQEFGRVMVPMIAEMITSVSRTERESAIQERTTIGRTGAATINRTLKAIARVLAGDDKVAYRSVLSASHMDLRSALKFSGTGRGWSNLPLAKWADARAELEKMSRSAARLANNRQLILTN